MSIEQLTDFDFGGVTRLLNVPDPASDQEPATKAYVDDKLEGLAWKDNVRFKTTANINLSSPGSSIDGGTPATSDRVLVASQTDAKQNGIYFWNGASSAMTRTPDADTFDKLENAVVVVDEGSTNAGTRWRQTAVNGTIGSNDVTFDTFDANTPDASETVKGKVELATQGEVDTGTDTTRAVVPATLAGWAGRKLKYTATFGDGSNTSYTITHNLGTKEVSCTVRKASDDSVVGCLVVASTTNTVTVGPLTSAPSSNSLKIVVLG